MVLATVGTERKYSKTWEYECISSSWLWPLKVWKYIFPSGLRLADISIILREIMYEGVQECVYFYLTPALVLHLPTVKLFPSLFLLTLVSKLWSIFQNSGTRLVKSLAVASFLLSSLSLCVYVCVCWGEIFFIILFVREILFLQHVAFIGRRLPSVCTQTRCWFRGAHYLHAHLHVQV